MPRRFLKVILIGDSGVGKTLLLNQYVHHRYCDNLKPTIGADFLTKNLVIDNDDVILQIWDTAGQERFRSLGSAFYRGADCCILVFDVNNAKSFTNVDFWRNRFLEQCNPPDPEYFPFILLGNKIDLVENRMISSTRAKLWSDNFKIPYFEVSANLNQNIDQSINFIVKSALVRNKMLITKDKPMYYYPLIEISHPTTSSSCCQ